MATERFMNDLFKVNTECLCRFSDTDAMGHVNNACYFSYMEQGRVAYISRLLPEVDYRDGLQSFPFILADIQCTFKAPLFCEEVVIVSLRASKMGRKSFDFEYLLTEKQSGREVATGQSVQVMYDYSKEETCPIPNELRRKIEELEGRPFS